MNNISGNVQADVGQDTGEVVLVKAHIVLLGFGFILLSKLATVDVFGCGFVLQLSDNLVCLHKS